MPRTLRFTDEQKEFVKANAHKGAKWLANELGVNIAWIYQYGHDNKISVKNQEVLPKSMKDKRSSWAWPRHYKHYKKLLVERDGLRCHYCDYLMRYEEAQIDHVIAKARGGSDAPINLVLACARCNGLKSTLCYSCPEFRDAIGK